MAATTAESAARPQLFLNLPFGEPEELETTWGGLYALLQEAALSGPPAQVLQTLQQRVASSLDRHAEASAALLFGMLTVPAQAQNVRSFLRPTAYPLQYFKYLAYVVRDGYALLSGLLCRLINERYPRLLEGPRSQLLWLIRELTRVEATDLSEVVAALFRHLPSFDPAQRSVWLAEQLTSLLEQNRPWLQARPPLVALVVYALLRCLSEQTPGSLTPLAERQAALALSLLRERVSEAACRISLIFLGRCQSAA
jgi:hypothetical protein